jgi:zinc protease
MHRIIPVATAAVALTLLAACAGLNLEGARIVLEPYDESTAVAKAPPLPAIDIPFRREILPNGLTLVVHEDRKAPIVAVNVWYHVGSKDEAPGRTGFAHLFEHLMFQGSENYRDEYFKPFEEVGATDMNGTTWLDRTNYFQNVPTTAVDLALWMESDRMGHFLGAVDQKVLDEQRGVVQNEKRQGENRPYGQVWERLQLASFPEGHPYRWTTIGSMEDLEAASLDDVKAWFRTWYGAANVTLVLAGDIDFDTAREKVLKYFGHIPAGPPLARRTEWVAARTASTREVMQDRVAQVRIYRTWNAPRDYSRDADLLSLATRILGGSRTSRLYERLVHRDRIADNVSARVLSFELASLVFIQADVKAGVDPAQVEAAIDQELKQFIERGPTAAEVRRAQTAVEAGFLRGIERIGGFGGKADVLAAAQVYTGNPAAWRESLGRMLAATPAELRQVTARWLAQGDHTLTVEPYPAFTTLESAVDRSKGVPKVAEFPDLSFPALQRARLKNGMEVVLAERHDVPLVSIEVQFDAGYAADIGRTLGTSSFTTAMLDEGTTSMSALQIATRAEELGARISTGSGLDTSSVSLSALKARLPESLALLADVTRNPSFDESEFDRLRGQWLAGIAQEKTDPVSLALRTVPPLLYGKDHPYAIPFTGSGTEESIQSLQPSDLRDFHRAWLRPDNARILVAGAVTLSELVPALDRVFGDWKAPAAPRSPKNIAGVTLPEKARVFLIDRPGSQQSVIIGGLLAPSGLDPKHIEIGTMNSVFGGTFTSRLNMNLREDKGWSYGARSLIPGAVGQRPYLLYAPVQTDKTAESIGEILKEVRGYVGRSPARRDEIGKIKAKDVRSLPGRYETIGAVLDTVSSIVLYGRPDDYVETLKERIEAQNDDDIRAQAREILRPDRITWVIVGDLAKIEAPVRRLNLGEVRVLDTDGKVVR